MKLFKNTVLTVLISLFAFSAQAAEWTPFQLSLYNPVQLFSEETDVQGARFNLIYGVNKNLDGVDYGPVNHVTDTTTGVQLGAFPFGGVNLTGKLVGMQIAGFVGGINYVKGDVNGLQFSGVLGGVNVARNVEGVQVAGLFIGVNLAKKVNGIQLASIYNNAETVEGLQIGLFNFTRKMNGMQIGLINIIRDNNSPFIPIINASF